MPVEKIISPLDYMTLQEDIFQQLSQKIDNALEKRNWHQEHGSQRIEVDLSQIASKLVKPLKSFLIIEFPAATTPIMTTFLTWTVNLHNCAKQPSKPFTYSNENGQINVSRKCYNYMCSSYIDDNSGSEVKVYFVKEAQLSTWKIYVFINQKLSDFTVKFASDGLLDNHAPNLEMTCLIEDLRSFKISINLITSKYDFVTLSFFKNGISSRKIENIEVSQTGEIIADYGCTKVVLGIAVIDNAKINFHKNVDLNQLKYDSNGRLFLCDSHAIIQEYKTIAMFLEQGLSKDSFMLRLMDLLAIMASLDCTQDLKSFNECYEKCFSYFFYIMGIAGLNFKPLNKTQYLAFINTLQGHIKKIIFHHYFNKDYDIFEIMPMLRDNNQRVLNQLVDYYYDCKCAIDKPSAPVFFSKKSLKESAPEQKPSEAIKSLSIKFAS